MKTQSLKINKNHCFYSVPGLAAIETFASLRIQILVWCVLVVASKIMKKWAPRGLEILLKPITNKKSSPKKKKTPQGRPKRPPGRLYGALRRPQDASKTPPGRFQDDFKSFRKRDCFLYRFRDPKITPKRLPKTLQDAPRTHLNTMPIQTDRPTETHRQTVR